MSEPKAPAWQFAVALLHYPVYDRNRRTVATSITNLDLHDIARAARTFGAVGYYVVTPVPDQQELAERIGSHWREGWGASYNPRRREALETVRVLSTLDEALDHLAAATGRTVRLVLTGAAERTGSLSCGELSRMMDESDDAFLIVFGTGWGLADEIFARADHVLEPIRGRGHYNHLSVRSAAAIILDRLAGGR